MKRYPLLNQTRSHEDAWWSGSIVPCILDGATLTSAVKCPINVATGKCKVSKQSRMAVERPENGTGAYSVGSLQQSVEIEQMNKWTRMNCPALIFRVHWKRRKKSLSGTRCCNKEAEAKTPGSCGWQKINGSAPSDVVRELPWFLHSDKVSFPATRRSPTVATDRQTGEYFIVYGVLLTIKLP
jgi:hypothetical protein